MADENYSYSRWGCLLKKIELIIWYLYSCFIHLKWRLAQYLQFLVFKSYGKIKIKCIQMVLYDHGSIQVLHRCALIPASQKVIKPRPYRIYRQKTGSCFWSVNYTRSKIPFLCSGNELQIFEYLPFEWTLCIDTYRINFVYQKMDLQGNIAELWKKKIIMILNTFKFLSGKQHQNRDVAATLIPGRKADVGNTTF